MQDKQKVTLYLPPELRRQLKIRAAVEAEPMSAIAERALFFYLRYPEVVEEKMVVSQGKSHRVYECPTCKTSVVLREDDLVAVGNQPSILALSEEVRSAGSVGSCLSSTEGELVSCL